MTPDAGRTVHYTIKGTEAFLPELEETVEGLERMRESRAERLAEDPGADVRDLDMRIADALADAGLPQPGDVLGALVAKVYPESGAIDIALILNIARPHPVLRRVTVAPGSTPGRWHWPTWAR